MTRLLSPPVTRGLPLVALGPASIDDVREAARRALAARRAQQRPGFGPAPVSDAEMEAWVAGTGAVNDEDARAVAAGLLEVRALEHRGRSLAAEIGRLRDEMVRTEALAGSILGGIRPKVRWHGWLRLLRAAGIPYGIVKRTRMAIGMAERLEPRSAKGGAA